MFQQARPDAPFANVGSVHAPDPEMALQNARDVFVRRPQTHTLWVVPADKILSRTAQEIEDESWHEDELPAPGNTERFYVFRKTSQRRSMTFVTYAAEETAPSASQALRQVYERLADAAKTFVWWIVPVKAVVASTPEDAPSMFEPAYDKDYRMPTQYHTQTMMRELEDGDESA